MNYIKEINLKESNLYQVIIEIQKGTKNKYELEPETFEKVYKDRKVKCRYPYYYGCFPQTLAGDKDPLDMILISKKKRKILDIVKVVPIGMIRTIDFGDVDDKVIVVAYDEKIKNIEKELKKVYKFLARYKGNKAHMIIDETFYDENYAKKIIEIAHKNYTTNTIEDTNYPKFKDLEYYKWFPEDKKETIVKRKSDDGLSSF